MGNLFSIESPFFHWLSKMADRMILNILFVISSIPVITIGAAITALYSVTGRINRDEGHVWKDYWRAFRSNFKQATAIWAVLLVSGLLIGFGVLFYVKTNQSGSVLGTLIVAVLLFLWAVTFAWAFPLQSRFDNTIRNTLKNALLFGLMNFPKSVVVAFTNLIPLFAFVLFPTAFLYLLFIWLMLWFAVAAAITLNIFKKQFEELEKMSKGERVQITEEGS